MILGMIKLHRSSLLEHERIGRDLILIFPFVRRQGFMFPKPRSLTGIFFRPYLASASKQTMISTGDGNKAYYCSISAPPARKTTLSGNFRQNATQ